jgi:Glycosyltransferase family 92
MKAARFTIMFTRVLYTVMTISGWIFILELTTVRDVLNLRLYSQRHSDVYSSQVICHQMKIPVLVAAIPHWEVGLYYSLFDTDHIKWNSTIKEEYLHSKWVCNCHAKDCGSSFMSRINLCSTGHTAVVKCPLYNTTDVSLTFQNFTYNFSAFLHINRLKENEDMRRIKYRNVSFVACTSVRRVKNLSLLKAWIIYHKLIGFDYFWIYYDRSPDELKHAQEYFSHNPFVHIIDYSYNISDMDYYNQPTIQNECLYRSKSMGFNWLALHDIDEFITVISSRYHTEKKLIDAVTKNVDKSTTGGILFKNWFFGKNKNENVSDLVLEYTAKSRTYTKIGREKIIILPENVNFHCVHIISDGLKAYNLSPHREGFLAHFKFADAGPHGSRKYKTSVFFKINFASRIRDVMQDWDYGEFD